MISNMRDDHELERVVFTTRLADGFAVELPEGYYSLAALIYDGHEDEPEGGAGAEGIAVHAESHTLVELGIETRGDGSLSDTLATHAPSIPARLIAPDGGALPLGVVTTIGRASESVIVIDDPTVSRHHAVIEFVGDGYVIHDLASSNGTFLNGYRVQQSRLQGGDVVRVGSIELLFRSR